MIDVLRVLMANWVEVRIRAVTKPVSIVKIVFRNAEQRTAIRALPSAGLPCWRWREELLTGGRHFCADAIEDIWNDDWPDVPQMVQVIQQIVAAEADVIFTPFKPGAVQIGIRAESLVAGKLIALTIPVQASADEWQNVLERCCNCVTMLRVQVGGYVEPFEVKHRGGDGVG